MSAPQVHPTTSRGNSSAAAQTGGDGSSTGGEGGVSSSSSKGQSNMKFLKEMSKASIQASEKINFIKESTNQLELEKEESPLEVARLRTKKFMSTHWLGILYFNILLTISVASCFQYILQTYLRQGYSIQGAEDINVWFDKIEIGLAVLFMWDWCLSFFMADHKWFFVSSFYSMVDLLTVIPIWITRYGVVCVLFTEIKDFKDFLIYFICGLKTTRILRALRIKRKLNKIEDDIERCLGEITLLITVMILFDSAVMQYLEQETQPFNFHTWMYYIWVTIATVGYGDITPNTDLGRVGAMVIICVAIVSIPKMTNELIEKMAMQTVYQRAHFMPKSDKSDHIVICGDISSCQLEEFFAELFHEDHENDDQHVVVLQPVPPSMQMITKILEHTVYQISVTYLEGTALLDKDLMRAKASQAKAVLIMTNKFSDSVDNEDAKTILNLASLKRHISAAVAAASDSDRYNSTFVSEPLVCLQLHRPENKRHLHIDPSNADTNMILCLNEIKLGVIAKTILFPGINTLIVNLLTSFADDDDDDDDDDNDDEDADVENLDDEGATNWDGEYLKGCGWEIYTTPLSTVFEGAKFAQLSEMLYQKLGIVLFALEIEDLDKDKSHMRLLVNPGDYVIPSQDNFRIEAFVIARNKKESDLSFSDEDNNDNSKDKSGKNSEKMKINTSSLVNIDELAERGDSISVVSAIDSDKHTIKEFAWQALMHKYESSASKSVSFQEELQRQEEMLLRRDFFIRSVPCPLSLAMIDTSVIVEVPNIDKHIIIIGRNVNNLYDLIRPLRAKYVEVLKYIVILCPDDIPTHVWRRINVFEAILVVKGSGLEEDDLRRACVYRASQIIVLADTGQLSHLDEGGSRNKSGEAEALVDADAIFTFQSVKKMNDKALVVLEIVRQNNISYIADNGSVSDDYKFSPLFAAGVLFTSSFLDTLVVQSFYNPKIIGVLNELISGVDSKQTDSKKKGLASIQSSCLYLIPIPDNLESRTYGALYKYLSKENKIPCGLYRGVFPQTRSGPKHNNMCYVYTNPSTDTELFACDKVYVFSQTAIMNTKINGMELTKEIIMLEDLRSKKIGSTEDLALKTAQLCADMNLMKESSEIIQRDISDLKGELLGKIDSFLTRSFQADGLAGNEPASTEFQRPLVKYSSNNNTSTTTIAGKTRIGRAESISLDNNPSGPAASQTAASILKLDGTGGYRSGGAGSGKGGSSKLFI